MLKKLKFWITADRLGPDMPLTHMLLHSSRIGKWLCQKKFRQFGKNSSFRTGAYAITTRGIAIGENVVIRPGTMLFASPLGEDTCQIAIEDFALIGSGVHIYVSNHEFRDTSKPIFFQGHSDIKPVVIRSGAWIGANAIILPGVTIGKNSIIGAGSVVTRSIPDFCVAVGNPAKIIKKL
jgi:acetyltransferase-like isoleucine patch superfamily enzyme